MIRTRLLRLLLAAQGTNLAVYVLDGRDVPGLGIGTAGLMFALGVVYATTARETASGPHARGAAQESTGRAGGPPHRHARTTP